MGWRIRKSVKLMPGVRLNLSRRGPSVSAGVGGVYWTGRGPGGSRPRAMAAPSTGTGRVASWLVVLLLALAAWAVLAR
jgi:hypothetical protein